MQQDVSLKKLALSVPLAFAISLAAQAQDTADDPEAVAQLEDPQGNPAGTVTVKQLEHGLLFSADLKNLPAGGHAFHVHETGACEPDFQAAGGHYAPLGNEHGLDTPDGYHAGDLPNIYVAEDGTARADFFVTQLTLSRGEAGTDNEPPFPVLDKDGSAIMIHENPDDYEAVPPDSSGGRIACGVIGQSAGN